MQYATFHWNDLKHMMPDDESLVLLVLDDHSVVTGYHDAEIWRYESDDPIEGFGVIWWADIPEPPRPPEDDDQIRYYRPALKPYSTTAA